MPQGVVSEYLIELIAKQVEGRGLVVWYDPEQAYTSVADALDLPDTTVARYDGSFFALRREIDHLINDQQPPRLVVYVPEDRGNTHNALAELEAAGVVVQPGQQPPIRNTRLAVVARNALRPILGEDLAADVEKRVEPGKLTLADLDAMAERGQEISRVVLLIFGSTNPHEVVLAFLASEGQDRQIEEKSATGELRGLLQDGFDITLPESASLADIRERLARYVLLTDLVTKLGDAVPSALESVPMASKPASVESCVHVATNWRLRRDIRDSYVTAAEVVEKEFSLSKLEFDPERIVEVETFPAVERVLLRHAENALLEKADQKLLDLAESRLSCFWSDVKPAIQAHWALIASAAEVLLEADRVAEDLKTPPATVPTLIKCYAEGKQPWCLLDSHHRHMESRWHKLDWHRLDLGEDAESLEKLIAKARHRYVEIGSDLAKHFVEIFEKAKHPVEGVRRQVDVFCTQVKPKLDEGKIAYVWVDALRFEMARALCEILKEDFDLSIEPAIATIPTITEIGMAALLPRADQSAKVVTVGGGRLALEIGGTVVKNRNDRIAYLEANAGVPVFAAKLDDLLPKPRKKVREGIEGATLVLVTSQEIDELCEKDNITQARRQMDGVLNDLRRGVRVLADHGVKSIVMVADHGHLFAEEVGDDMKIDPPGGGTADLHKRVWLGVGGTSDASYLRAPLSSLGVESDLDIATPWRFGVFRQKGKVARAYFHGGLSPQELIIPVVVMTPKAEALIGPPTGIDWTLTPGTEKLTTRFFSVQVAAVSTGLFDLEPPKVRVEVRARGKCVSRPVSASYGFEDATGEVQLKQSETDTKKTEPNTITVMLLKEVSQKTVGLYLVEATSGAELHSLDKIEVAISF